MSYYQELFDYMANEHDVTLLEQDMKEVVGIVSRMLSEPDETQCKLLQWLNTNCTNVQKMENPITNAQAESIVSEYSKDGIKDIFECMENFKPLRKKYTSANLTFKAWIRQRRTTNPNYAVKVQEKATEEKQEQTNDLINNM